MSADRNLLFGILALQMDLITRDQLIAAMNAWVIDKPKSLGEILVQQRAMQPGDLALLEPLVARHIEQHGNDPQKSLAALSSVSSVGRDLKDMADADVQASLAHMTIDYAPQRSSAAAARPQERDGIRYRVLRRHARGALGEVFVAEDLEVHRSVALKEIQERHADDAGSRGRFLLEAEITGRLEHPGIVPVYGLGVYPDGRPYYAMRFIKGDNLAAAINRFHAQPAIDYHALEFRRLLQRFIDVCNAVAYAHSRGVLHRDLKPGNIMLGEFGETLLVDWGLAKIIGQPENVDSEETIRPSSGSSYVETLAGAAVGTPAYMSPEQAEGKLDELNSATDVYSLGATLYVLLTGRPPVEKDELPKVLEKVRRGDIPPPLTVQPAVPRALNAVCMKAMAHQPADRYATAQALAADIEHWLADEPVAALADPLSIRARRWMRKHPGLVAALAASLVVGMVGLSGLAWQKEQARSAIAQQESETAKQRDLADGRFDMALTAFNQMVFDMQFLLEKRAGTVEVRRELLAKARPGLEKLLQEAEAARGADHTLVSSYFGMGDVALKLGDPKAAVAEYTKGNEMARRLADADATNTVAQRDLGISFVKIGDGTRQSGNAPGSLAPYRQGLEIFRRLADANPKNAEAQRSLTLSLHKLGNVARQLGQTTSALEYFREALDIAQRQADADPKNAQARRDLTIAFNKVGDVALLMGDAPGALGYYRKSLDIRQQVADADPKDAEAQYDVSTSLNDLGDVCFESTDGAGALEYYRRSLAIRQRLADADPKNAQAQQNVFINTYKAACALQVDQQFAAARAEYAKSQTMLERFQKEGWIKKPEQLIGTWTFQQWLDEAKRNFLVTEKAEKSAGSLEFALEQPAKEVPELLYTRARVLARKKDAAGCLATAEAMANLKKTDAEGLSSTGCLFSICAGVAADRKDECCAKAMDCLNRAAAAGYKDYASWKLSQDWDALRDRADFKQLIADLEAKARTAKPKG